MRIPLLCIFIFGLGSIGCTSHPQPTAVSEVYAYGTLADRDGVGRSLTFNAPSVAAADDPDPVPRSSAGSTATAAATVAWYHDRLDRPRSVASGFATPTVETVTTYSYDRQSVFRCRVLDSYDRTTFRTSVNEGVR